MKPTRLFIGIAIVIAAILVTFALSNAQALVGPITFDLEEQNASGESGTVTLTDLGAGKTMVEVTASGQPAESSQPMQVHEGQCGPTLARIAYPLNNLESGKSTTTINASLSSLTTENSTFAINGHKSEEEYTDYVLCGNIPSLAMVAARATATQQALVAMQTRPPGGIAPVTFNLVAENESGQSGTVTLSDLGGGKTMVQVAVTGEPTGAIQPLHIHEGQCGPTLARLAYKLTDLVEGKSDTTVDASLSALTSEGFQFAINSHKSQKEYTVYVLCGNIPSVSQGTGNGAAPTAVIVVATTVAATEPAATAVAATPTTVAPTATVLAPTVTKVAPTVAAVVATAQAAAPTATAAAPTGTKVASTATTVAPSATKVAPTATTVAPTATAVAPTATALAPTATAIAPAATKVAPTVAAVVATAKVEVPTATTAAPTANAVAPTATVAASTATTIAPTATKVAPTAAAVVATAAAIAPTETTVAPAATAVAPTSESAEATAIAPTANAAQATAVVPTSDAAQATSVASTSAGTPTATPAATIPKSGGDPYSTTFLGLTMLGILIIAAGLSLVQFGERGFKGL